MRDEALLDQFAQATAIQIISRHAGDRDALIEAIRRLVRLGLEGNVRQFELEHQRPDD